MKLRTRLVRRAHRVLGVVIGVQLLLWTISGAFFAWTDLDEVHGDHHRETPATMSLGGNWVAPTAVDLASIPGFDAEQLDGMDLVPIAGAIHYRFVDAEGTIVLANVESGQIRQALSQAEATALARASFAPDVAVRSARRITDKDVGAHHEYRGGLLPAWVIEFEHSSNTRVYVAEPSGEVTKHRNRIWRAFDFFWMLHTMDYRGRDDFNHPLLRAVAVLAIVLALSGFLLWGRTSMVLRRK